MKSECSKEMSTSAFCSCYFLRRKNFSPCQEFIIIAVREGYMSIKLCRQKCGGIENNMKDWESGWRESH